MPGLLASQRFIDEHSEALAAIARDCATDLECVALPSEERLDEGTLARITLAFSSGDLVADRPALRRFLGSARAAEGLQWLQLSHAGVDAPVFGELLARGVRISTASGETAEPIAQTAIAGLLALARGFPDWQEAQRRRAWEPTAAHRVPRDLRGQTLLVLGLGAIGNQVARLGQALGLHVIGVRRSPRLETDHVDELHPPSALDGLWPRADWLVVACPLTEATRGLVDAAALRTLPAGAQVLNVARGEIVDEAALTEALRDGHLAGAYLDVFAVEPLPEDSPLWALPRVIVSPHSAAAAGGNQARTDQRFLRNLPRWLRGEPLEGEVTGAS